MELFIDYYGILGVPRYTNDVGIRRAYLRKAWQYHPDLHPEDSNTASSMSAVNVAFATLSDPVRRAKYDARRGAVHVRLDPGAPSPSPAPRHRQRYARKNEPGVLHIALAMFTRLFRYATATLPC